MWLRRMHPDDPRETQDRCSVLRLSPRDPAHQRTAQAHSSYRSHQYPHAGDIIEDGMADPNRRRR